MTQPRGTGDLDRGAGDLGSRSTHERGRSRTSGYELGRRAVYHGRAGNEVVQEATRAIQRAKQHEDQRQVERKRYAEQIVDRKQGRKRERGIETVPPNDGEPERERAEKKNLDIEKEPTGERPKRADGRTVGANHADAGQPLPERGAATQALAHDGVHPRDRDGKADLNKQGHSELRLGPEPDELEENEYGNDHEENDPKVDQRGADAAAEGRCRSVCARAHTDLAGDAGPQTDRRDGRG